MKMHGWQSQAGGGKATITIDHRAPTIEHHESAGAATGRHLRGALWPLQDIRGDETTISVTSRVTSHESQITPRLTS